MSEYNDLGEKIAHAKRRLPMPALMAREGLSAHAKKTAHCPFHDDQHKSFSIFQGKGGFWHWKCFAGCGDGDEIMLIRKLRGVSLSEAMSLYLDMAGFPRSCPPVSREFLEARKSPDSRTSRVSRECPESLVSHVSNGQALEVEFQQLAARNACTAPNTARRRRFKFVRDLRAVEQRIGRELEIDELAIAFNEWHRLSLRFLDPAKSRDHYWAAFVAELGKVLVPTGEGALKKALENLNLSASDLPAIPRYAEAPESWRRLTALHRELSAANGGNTYFLAYRDAAKAVPGISHQQAHNITLALVRLGVVEVVRVGDARPNGGNASEFRYLLSQTENDAEDDEGFDL